MNGRSSKGLHTVSEYKSNQRKDTLIEIKGYPRLVFSHIEDLELLEFNFGRKESCISVG